MNSQETRTESLTQKKGNALTMQSSDLAPWNMRKHGGYKPTAKPKGTAQVATITNASMRETYKSGMGDTPVFYRPGSLDFLKCKSVGVRC